MKINHSTQIKSFQNGDGMWLPRICWALNKLCLCWWSLELVRSWTLQNSWPEHVNKSQLCRGMSKTNIDVECWDAQLCKSVKLFVGGVQNNFMTGQCLRVQKSV